ncbi:MAG: putative surface protein bspA-like [Candidatus Malacoplasma girerdii]|nr:MAG: putative surface protein bspA-like [Candidatus Malacoplasma girerdii]
MSAALLIGSGALCTGLVANNNNHSITNLVKGSYHDEKKYRELTKNELDLRLVKKSVGSKAVEGLSVSLKNGAITGDLGDFKIADKYTLNANKYYPVIEINPNGFKDNLKTNTSGSNVLLPSTLLTIGENAFRLNSSKTNKIKNITFLSDALQSIGAQAFRDQDLLILTNEVLPSSLKEIGAHAFENCKKLNSSIVFGSNMEKIGPFAFYNTTNTENFFFNWTRKYIEKNKGVISLGQGNQKVFGDGTSTDADNKRNINLYVLPGTKTHYSDVYNTNLEKVTNTETINLNIVEKDYFDHSSSVALIFGAVIGGVLLIGLSVIATLGMIKKKNKK